MATITYNQDPFIKLEVPIFDKIYFEGIFLPKHFPFNKTLYKLENTKLQAFRLLGISIGYHINKFGCKVYNTYYYIQLPNDKPFWCPCYLATNSVVFNDKNDFFDYLNGNKEVNINSTTKSKWSCCESLLNGLPSSMIFNHNKNRIFNDWYWDTIKQEPLVHSSTIRYFLMTKDGVQFCLDCKENHFKTKEECIQNHLNGFVIDDFEDNPFSVEIEVLPNKARKYILQFEEVF
jgi:hypothetical protein